MSESDIEAATVNSVISSTSSAAFTCTPAKYSFSSRFILLLLLLLSLCGLEGVLRAGLGGDFGGVFSPCAPYKENEEDFTTAFCVGADEGSTCVMTTATKQTTTASISAFSLHPSPPASPGEHGGADGVRAACCVFGACCLLLFSASLRLGFATLTFPVLMTASMDRGENGARTLSVGGLLVVLGDTIESVTGDSSVP